MHLSKNKIKKINSLRQKKHRISCQLFVAEGVKIINELLHSQFVLEHLYCTENMLEYNKVSPKTIISEVELKKISSLKTPNKALAIFKIPPSAPLKNKGISVALDNVNDPGNLGTIIRLCDWFGVSQLLCSTNTADCYNPKVIQASMGSISRVSVQYVDLPNHLQKVTLPVYIADMNGDSVYKTQLPDEAILVMGNEANGICNEIRELATNCISIPRFGNLQQTESLNVATATAILLSEFKR